MLAALAAEGVPDLRGVGEQRLHPFTLHVEDAERRRRALRLRLAVELRLVLVEPRGEAFDVGRTALAVSDRIELEHVVGDADAPQKLCVQLNDLGIDRRVVGTDRLDGKLPVLAVAPTLWPVVPPHRADRVELLRLGFTVQAVL